jgi:DNA-binding CsgD family transcriptional regulator
MGIGGVPVRGVVNLLETLTTRKFCRTLLQEVNAWTRVDHCMVMRLTGEADLQVFGCEHRSPFESRGSKGAIAYLDYYHRFDPNRRLLERGGAGGGTIIARHHKAVEIRHRDYRRMCYEDAGVVERLSFLTADNRGGLIALNLYRQEESSGFSDHDVETLGAVAPLFTVAAARHIGLLLHATSDPASWRQRLKAVCPEMTGRELDVAAHLLAGRTLRQASETLGVAHSSVVTYRERAYSRLGVSNLRELRDIFAAA